MLKILNSFQYAEEHITSVKQGNLEHIFTRDFHKKGYPQTLKFLPIPPNIPMTPIHAKK